MSAGDHTGWQAALVSAALVGTSRRPPPPPPAGWPLPDTDRSEQRLLDSAALWQAAVRAGLTPSPDSPAAPAPPERHPLAPAEADQLLRLLLEQPPVPAVLVAPLLRQWLGACAEHRLVPDAARLPALLDRATRDRSVRAALARVDSARLRWLAAANPDWRLPEGPEEEDPAGATSEQDWARLPASARPAVLRRERAADPDHGRELVESSWGTDRARERAALLAVLAEQPHPGDADLLERALDDPSSTVRAAAVAALGRLPGSRRARRMTERLAALVTVHRARGLARLRSALPLVEVARPGEPDESGVRDGLDEPTSGSRTDHWLTQLTAGTPLSWWTEQLGVGPAEVWRAVTEPAVRQGLVEATGLQQDAGWATALWELVDRPPASWLALVPAEQRERHALQRLRADTARSAATAGRRRGTLAARQVGAEALLHVPGPWGEELSRTVLDLLARAEAGTGALPVEVLATRLHPAARAVLTDRVVARETATLVAHVLQYQSASDSIREAFR